MMQAAPREQIASAYSTNYSMMKLSSPVPVVLVVNRDASDETSAGLGRPYQMCSAVSSAGSRTVCAKCNLVHRFNLVEIAMRAEREVIDKIVDGLKFHSWRVGPINSRRPADVRFEGLMQGCEQG
jgi:uncharacterized hydantoinase/oxoprolinase family protein